MVCAQLCALWACSEKPSAKPAQASAAQYSLERPVEGLPAPRLRGSNFRRGVSLELFVTEVAEAQRAAYDAWLEQIVRLGATDLELIVQWSQLDAKAVEMAPSAGSTVDDDFLGWLMDRAAARELRVLLTPLVDVEERAAGKRVLDPGDHKRWFWSYHRVALHYARIAEAHHALAFSVGTDLPALDAPDDAEWRALIGDVRKAFKGQVTYGVRPDHLALVTFWDALDCASVVGVGELLPGAAGQTSQALAAFGGELRAWAKAHEKKPLLLTALVAGSQAAAGELPRVQLEGARALYRELAPEPALAGLYLNLPLPAAPFEPAQLASAPAEVLRFWYARSRGAQAPN